MHFKSNLSHHADSQTLKDTVRIGALVYSKNGNIFVSFKFLMGVKLFLIHGSILLALIVLRLYNGNVCFSLHLDIPTTNVLVQKILICNLAAGKSQVSPVFPSPNTRRVREKGLEQIKAVSLIYLKSLQLTFYMLHIANSKLKILLICNFFFQLYMVFLNMTVERDFHEWVFFPVALLYDFTSKFFKLTKP